MPSHACSKLQGHRWGNQGSEMGGLSHSTLTLIQQRLDGELVIRPLDIVLEGGDVALLAEAVGGRIHSFDLAHIALFEAPVGRGCRVSQSASTAEHSSHPTGDSTHFRIMSWTPCLTLAKVTVSERL